MSTAATGSVSRSLSWRHALGLVHLWAGIALCVPLVLIGLTGSLLVFEDELRAAFESPQPRPAGGAARSAEGIVAAARATQPGSTPVLFAPPAGTGDLATVRLTAPGEARPRGVLVRVDPVSLETFDGPTHSGVLRWIAALHANLLMRNTAGRPLVGWLGVAMLVLGVTGIVNWWPRPRRWRQGFVMRKGARGMKLQRDLHGVVGIWGLLVFMVVSFSGVYLAFPQALRAVAEQITPVRDLRRFGTELRVAPPPGATQPPIGDIMNIARQAAPDLQVRFLNFPARPDQPWRISLARPGQKRGTPTVTAIVDPWQHRVLAVLDPRDLSATEAALAWQRAIHAGAGLGPLWQGLVFLSGFLPLLFTVTGVRLWWLKRRRRNRNDMSSMEAGASHG